MRMQVQFLQRAIPENDPSSSRGGYGILCNQLQSLFCLLALFFITDPSGLAPDTFCLVWGLAPGFFGLISGHQDQSV